MTTALKKAGPSFPITRSSAPKSTIIPRPRSVPAASDLVLNAPVSLEIGPAILMPDDKVFCAGATGHTALYNVKTGTWSSGPDFPTDSGGNLMRAFDAPAGPASKRARSMRRWCCCHEWCRRGLGRFPDQLFRV